MKPLDLIQTGRQISGVSATLVPFLDDGAIDWPGFENHLVRTIDAGLIPAVNMDTGYVNLLTNHQRQEVLTRSRVMAGPDAELVAGAFVDSPNAATFDLEGYQRAIDQIVRCNALPIIFQSAGLVAGDEEETLGRYRDIAESCDRFIAFELGKMFAPFGAIYSAELFEELTRVPQCVGLKHSSLSRELEWQRLEIRNRLRPDFRLYTGNDLAIDMVMYGCDYLLGLSTMHPAAFARRDEFWKDDDARFFALNDALQYLGCFAFRPPVPAYKHSAAMMLKLQGWIESDATHPDSPRRPDSDREVLREILSRIDMAMQ